MPLVLLTITGFGCDPASHETDVAEDAQRVETRKAELQGDELERLESQTGLNLPNSNFGVALDYHIAMAHGSGSLDYEDVYLDSLISLKQFPNLVQDLTSLIDSHSDPGQKWLLVQVLADLDDCDARVALESIATRTHPPLGVAPCEHCDIPNIEEALVTLRAVSGLERLLGKQCYYDTIQSLVTVANNAQVDAGANAAVAALRYTAKVPAQEIKQQIPATLESVVDWPEYDLERDAIPFPELDSTADVEVLPLEFH